MDEPTRPANTLPPDVTVLVELLFERLGAGTGSWRLEFTAVGGDLRKWKRQEEGGANELARFDRTEDT